MAGEESLYWQGVQSRARSSGKTPRQVMDEDRAKAREPVDYREECTGVLSYAEDLIREGVRVVQVAPIEVDMPELPDYLRFHGEHVRTCDFCKLLIHTMTPRSLLPK